MKNRTWYWNVLILMVLPFLTRAQQFPISGNTILVSPTLPYIERFIEENPTSLMLQLVLTDQTASSFDIGLRLHISGQGISIISDPLYLGNIFSLSFNTPLLLTGYDLADYFNPDNLLFSGISKEQYLANGRLPEGYYSICFEAFDLNNPNSLAISNKACGSGIIQDFDPPIIISPEGEINYSDFNHYLFSWQALHPLSIPIIYYLDIYEKTVGLSDAQIIEFESPIASIEVNNFTSYIFTQADPLLKNNQSYLILLKSFDPTGQIVFKNNGISQLSYFSTLSSDENCIPNQPCDDQNPCTINDIIDSNCHCIGEETVDSDNDGICDPLDICDGFDDNLDSDNNGIPDCLGTCEMNQAPVTVDATQIEKIHFNANWDINIDCHTAYTLQISTDSLFQDIVQEEIITDIDVLSYHISDIDLRSNNYFYRVSYRINQVNSPFSNVTKVSLGRCQKLDSQEIDFACGILDSTSYDSDIC